MKAGVKKKQLTDRQRWLRNGLFLLVCGLLGFLSGYFADSFSRKDMISLVNVDTVLWVVRGFLVLVILVCIWYLKKAYSGHKAYEADENEDDETVDKLYSGMFRALEYATVASNVMTSLSLLAVILSTNFVIETNGASLSASMIDYAILVLVFIIQVVLIKLTQKIRNYKLSIFSTPSEIKDYVDSYDEGERQANFESSFATLFNLNQRVLPALYILIMIIEMISQTKQILALVVVAFIHIYINLAQIKGIRQYFK